MIQLGPAELARYESLGSICKGWHEHFYCPSNFGSVSWISALTFKIVFVLNIHLGSGSMINLEDSNALLKYMLPPLSVICKIFCILSKYTLKRFAEGHIFSMGD